MNEDYIRNWLIKASHDIKIAEIGLKQTVEEQKNITDIICFHSQQAVEKILKSYLISKNIGFGRTHDLESLLAVCGKEDNDFIKLDIGNLSDYAVEIRYADDFYIPSIEEAKEAFKIALKIKIFVLNKMKLSEDDINGA